MTLAPRFLVSFWAGLRVARLRRQLAKARNGVAGQETARRHLTAQLAATEQGRAHRLPADATYGQFQALVPLRTAEQLQPQVARMMRGEADVLWPGVCRLFVETAGTTTGQPQRLPITGEMLAHYRTGLATAVLLLAARTGHAGLFLGRHLHAGGSTRLTAAGDAYAGGLEAMLRLALTPWTEANLYAPAPAIAELPEGPAKAAQTAARMLARDVTVLGGNPGALHALAEAVRAQASSPKRRLSQLTALWPNLAGLVHLGAPLGLFGGELKEIAGPDVLFHEMLAAAEGCFAVQDGDASQGLRLLTEAGLFFEFLPWEGYDEAALAAAGPRCAPLADVRPGVDYVLVVTTPAGLARCVTGDIVRFTGLGPPRVQFVGRTRHQLAAFEERVGERELTDILLEVCAAHGWTPVNFHVAPLNLRPAPPARGAHEWWIELRPGTVKTPTGPFLGGELDRSLARRNIDYATRRADGRLAAPEVRLVMPGTFETWQQAYWPGLPAAKFPRARSDRAIADSLMAMARFHAGSEPPPAPRPVRTQHPFGTAPA